MRKNPHYRILKAKLKEQHLSIIPKSCSFLKHTNIGLDTVFLILLKYLFFSSLPTLIVNHFLSLISSTIFSKKTVITSQVLTQINLQTIQIGNKIHNHKKFLLFIYIDKFFHRAIHCSSTQIMQNVFITS